MVLIASFMRNRGLEYGFIKPLVGAWRRVQVTVI